MMERARQSWNERGYGRFALEVPGVADVIGFVGRTEIVSYTAATNLRSRRVMEKIGLRRDSTDDFE